MSYLVTAACVVAKDRDGRNHHHYEGDVITWLSEEQAEHFLASDLVEETDAGVGGSDPDGEPVEGAKPPADATNKELIDWIVANVAKEDGSDYTADELGPPLKKADLRAIVDSVED